MYKYETLKWSAGNQLLNTQTVDRFWDGIILSGFHFCNYRHIRDKGMYMITDGTSVNNGSNADADVLV